MLCIYTFYRRYVGTYGTAPSESKKMKARLRYRSLASLGLLAAAPGVEIGEQQARRPTSLHVWEAGIAQCPIVWFIHIPKTAGSTINDVLKRSNSDKVQYTSLGPTRNVYVFHGRNHNWARPDLLAMANRTERKIIVSAETPIADLKRHGYPWLSETCFFSVARDPYEWVISAANHMNRSISSRYGYFDHANIQSYMTGYGAGDHGAAFVCVGTLDHFLDVEHGLFPRFAENLTLPHLNARPHAVNITEELKEVVRTKYAIDLELWASVARQGLVCW